MSRPIRLLAALLFALALPPAPARAIQSPPPHWASRSLSALRAAEARADSARVASRRPAAGTVVRAIDADVPGYGLAAILEGVPVFRRTANVTESRIIGVEKAVRDYGLTGDQVRIGLWDEGHPFEHSEFGPRLEHASDGEGGSHSGHATHVAGTLAAAGLDAEARGMAPRAVVSAHGWANDYLEMYQAAAGGLRVSNHSYVLATGWERAPKGSPVDWTWFRSGDRFGAYGGWTWFWDWTMQDHPMYLVVKAAGNDAGQGPQVAGAPHFHDGFSGDVYTDVHPMDCAGGFGCLESLATSRNALVIGALDAAGASPAPFSSRGPTADGRLKPDLMTVGEGVYSTVSGDGYAVSSGTSMATPMAAGSVALLLEEERKLYGEPRLLSSTMKALLVHTADDLGAPGPDFSFGWGRVNTAAAVALLDADHASGGDRILQPHVAGTFDVVVRTDGSSLRATLAWIDPRGEDPMTRPDPTAPVLVHDFDLEVLAGGSVELPWLLDPARPETAAQRGRDRVNNVEQVVLPSTPAGVVTIRITAPPGVAQRVSLIVTTGDGAVATDVDPDPDPPFGGDGVLYPNPVRRGETLWIAAGTEVEGADLFDLTGRRVASWTRPGAGLPIPSWVAPGVYVVRLGDGAGVARVVVGL